VAALAAHEQTPHRAGIADPRRAAAARDLRRRAVAEVGGVALAGVDHHHPHRARDVEHAPARRDHRLQRRDIVAERLAEAAGLDEVALHVDDDERRRLRVEVEFVRLGLHRTLRHRPLRRFARTWYRRDAAAPLHSVVGRTLSEAPQYDPRSR
jgi:hypothetical protein